MRRPLLKDISAVILGFLAVFILSVATDAVLESSGVFPGQNHPELYTSWMLMCALAYRLAYAAVGGYVTARLASGRPMKLVTILGIIGTLGGIVGIVAGWNLSAHWYPIALAALSFPCVWLGGTWGSKI